MAVTALQHLSKPLYVLIREYMQRDIWRQTLCSPSHTHRSCILFLCNSNERESVAPSRWSDATERNQTRSESLSRSVFTKGEKQSEHSTNCSFTVIQCTSPPQRSYTDICVLSIELHQAAFHTCCRMRLLELKRLMCSFIIFVETSQIS